MSKSIRLCVSFLLVLQLIIPYSTFAAAVGEFSSVAGKVTQTRAKRVIRPVVKSPIQLKDLIVTARTSSATMVFSDESRIMLSENTKLEIKEFIIKDKSRIGIFTLPIGRLSADVKKYISGDNVFEVHSPTAVAGVRGTGFEFIEARNIENKGVATISCTEGSLNLSALSATGEVVSRDVLEAGQVAVIIGGIITISKIAAAVGAGVAGSSKTGTAGAAGGTGAGTGGTTATAGGGATTATAAGSGTTVAAGSAAAGTATAAAAGTATAAAGLSTTAIAGIAIGTAAVLGGAAAAGGGGGGGGGGSATTPSTPTTPTTACGTTDGRWSGTYSGNGCSGPANGAWSMNCSNCSCPSAAWNSALGENYNGNCTFSGNNVSCVFFVRDCISDQPCTLNVPATASGNSLNGTYSGCNGIGGTWVGTRQ